MMQNRQIMLGAFAALAAFIVVLNSFFIVDQTSQALVVRFGEVVREIKEPGLNVKVPFIENVVYFDNRILNLDPPPATLTLADQKRLVIDAFARWRITDAQSFYRALRTEAQAEARLDNLINGSLLDVMGTVPLADLLTDKRETVMATVRDRVNADVQRFGLTIVDIRIGRADLPPETMDAVFQRMASERKREAEQFRAEGDQKSQEIKSTADADRTILLSKAQRDAQETRGQGDQQAIKIYADAAKLDPEFYIFYRSLEAYSKGLPGDKTTLILSPTTSFFRYFSDPAGHMPAVPLKSEPAKPK
jgi:membrane protease subunit HflC